FRYRIDGRVDAQPGHEDAFGPADLERASGDRSFGRSKCRLGFVERLFDDLDEELAGSIEHLFRRSDERCVPARRFRYAKAANDGRVPPKEGELPIYREPRF